MTIPAADDFIRRHLRGAPDPATSLDEQRRLAAQRAGLPPGLAERLEGSTYDDLVQDAHTIANDLNPKPVPAFDGGPRPLSPGPAHEMSSLIRADRDRRQFGMTADPGYWDRLFNRHREHESQIANGPTDAA